MSPSVSGLVPLRVACADFRALLLHAPPFDFVHVDPFGSCVPFLDTLASRAAHGSVVSVTATDTSVLFANYPEVMTSDDL
jgi:tRNA (guanine26-N2/guanine27-N2)-dimethyltransferase